MIDVALPVVTRDAMNSPVVTLTATNDGQPFTTNVTTYHGMSDQHLADMAKVVDRFFATVKHVGLTLKGFARWEDKAYAVIARFRNKRLNKK